VVNIILKLPGSKKIENFLTCWTSTKFSRRNLHYENSFINCLLLWCGI